MIPQIPLGFRLRERASFDSFQPGENAQLLFQLRDFADGQGEAFLYLWGGPGSGRSHLLQAVCRQAAERQRTPAFIPLQEMDRFDPGIFSDLEQMDLVCIDDLQMIAGKASWEKALFRLFNRMREGGSQLLVSADQSPARLGVKLPDLHSRLEWGVSYRLLPLNDECRMQALIVGARRRGMELPQESARYIIRHSPRDMESLQRLLAELDRASLAAQRRLTVPFVKQILEAGCGTQSGH